MRERIDQARFAQALRRELATEAARLGRRRLTSVFFGGGTPSLMDPSTVAALLDDAARYFDVAEDLEITLEANPTSIEAGRLSDFRAAGVNRVSIGIQSLDETALRALGRQHSAGEAVAALALARRLFPRVSFDLIYARPGQDRAAWRAELRAALAIAADHLSLYQLTIEPATPFEALHRQGKIVLPDEDTAAALYDATEEECARAGLLAYEISNYARPGRGKPAQPGLLAVSRLRRHRAGRARAGHGGRLVARDTAAPRAGAMGRTGRAERRRADGG